MACGFTLAAEEVRKKKTKQNNTNYQSRGQEVSRGPGEGGGHFLFPSHSKAPRHAGEPRLRSNSWQLASKQSKVTWQKSRAQLASTTTTSLTATSATATLTTGNNSHVRNHDATRCRVFAAFFFFLFIFWLRVLAAQQRYAEIPKPDKEK